MPQIPIDPLFIPNKEEYFINLAKSVGAASTHPIASGGCVIVRDHEVIGSGRSLLAECKVEIDCVTYAIAAGCKRGSPMTGAVIYTTRYPFSASIFQMYVMGIRKIVVLAHEWEPYYKDEFRRSARLARELKISIEPFFEDDDQRFATNNQAPRFDDKEEHFKNKDLYVRGPAEPNDIDASQYPTEPNDTDTSTV